MSGILQTPPRCMWATKEDWIAKQGLIAQLYEMHPLPKVMHLMETQHGFKATIKMYKTRIKQWGLNKRNQQHEIRAVAHQRKQRRPVVQGKRFAIRLHGQGFDVGDVNRANKRREILADDINIPRLASTSSETMLECFTAVPTLFTTPWRLGISERIFNTIRDYYRGSFESGMWLSDQKGLHCWTVKAGLQGASTEDPSNNLNALLNQCTLACRLFAYSRYKEGGRALMSATALIEKILQADHPMTLSLLFELVVNVRWENRREIGLAVLRQFSALGEVLLGDEHPLRRICGWLASVDTACFDEVVVRCFRNAGEQLETNLGPMHRATLYSRLRYTEEVYRHKDINQAELRQRKDLLYKCERTLGAHDMRTLDIQSCLASRYLQRADYVTARKIGQDIIVRSRRLQSPSNRIHFRTKGLYIVAASRYNLHESESTTADLREAVALRVSQSGTYDIHAKFGLVCLEEWLLKYGHFSSVSEMKARTKRILEPVGTD